MSKDFNPNKVVPTEGVTNKFKDEFVFTKAFE